MFGGLGTAFSNANKTDDKTKTGATQGGAPAAAIPNVLKRNPFRGFGGGAARKAPEENNKKTGGFGGGFNSFRTFGRVRPAASKEQDDADAGNDESITFD